MAITLPLVLLLCDFLVGRAWTWRVFVAKLPFFLLSLVFGLGALLVHNFRWWTGAEAPRPVVSEEQKVHSLEEIVGDSEGPRSRPPLARKPQNSTEQPDPRTGDDLLEQVTRRLSSLLQPGIAIKQIMFLFWAVSLALGKALLLVPPSIINFAPPRVLCRIQPCCSLQGWSWC